MRVRIVVVLLAMIFLLNAADPTPRFLGMRRIPTEFQAGFGAVKVKPILPRYELPVSERVRSAEEASFLARLEVAVAFAAKTPASVLDVCSVIARGRAVRSSRASPPRDDSGPPLRC